MQYLFARAHAERTGAELRMHPSVVQKVFNVDHPAPETMDLPQRTERDIGPEEVNVVIRCYAQSDAAMIYTKEDALSWLTFRHTVDEIFGEPNARESLDSDVVLGHLRRGDFHGYGYPTISANSYAYAAASRGYSAVRYIQQEAPTPRGTLPEELSFLPDFYRLSVTPVLFRANSTFSWLAGTLNQGAVYAPVIDGLVGGQEHNGVGFVSGNWPRLAHFEFTTELRLKGERS
jgi:hypothetical protein